MSSIHGDSDGSGGCSGNSESSGWSVTVLLALPGPWSSWVGKGTCSCIPCSGESTFDWDSCCVIIVADLGVVVKSIWHTICKVDGNNFESSSEFLIVGSSWLCNVTKIHAASLGFISGGSGGYEVWSGTGSIAVSIFSTSELIRSCSVRLECGTHIRDIVF